MYWQSILSLFWMRGETLTKNLLIQSTLNASMFLELRSYSLLRSAMNPRFTIIVTVILSVSILVTVGGIGLAYHLFVQDIYVNVDIESSLGVTWSCAQECGNQGSSAATLFLGTDFDHQGVSSSGLFSISVPETGADTPSSILAATWATDSMSLPTHSSSSSESGLDSSRRFDSRFSFFFSLSSSSSATVFPNLVAPSVMFPIPTFKSDPPSLETSSYVHEQDRLDRDRESILRSHYTSRRLALLNL